jgi:thiosulfate/3-mercaptopyruvate sulfurtransferase
MSALITAAAAARLTARVYPSALFIDCIADARFSRMHVHGARPWPTQLPPTLLPPFAPAAAAVQAALLGGGDVDTVVIYDAGGVGAWQASRAAWWLHARGVRARVVDGGLPALLAAGARLASGAPLRGGGGGVGVEGGAERPAPRARGAAAARLVSLADLRADMERSDGARRLQLLDVRTPAEFAGDDFAARGNARGGRLPGAVLLPHTALFAADGRFLPRRALADAFAGKGLDPGRPVVAICQAGARASAAYVALRAAGFRKAALYDGAMREWLAQPQLPVEKG